jgi:hypothetical protein
MKKIISAALGLCSALSVNAQQFSAEVRRAHLRRRPMLAYGGAGFPVNEGATWPDPPHYRLTNQSAP